MSEWKTRPCGKSILILARCLLAGLLGSAVLAEPGKAGAPKEPATGVAAITVPPGFVVELVAAPPLVEHPMFGCFDDQGRLFVAEAAGKNLKAAELLEDFAELHPPPG